jgi:UDP-glucose:(glucosyl)LPS alpha-1,2-glucosyltransferase
MEREKKMKPLGGTELQLGFLQKYCSKNLLDKVQITTSVPEKEPLADDKINILWQKNSYDQPNIAPWFQDKTNHKKYDWYVFNSHWNYEKYRMMFDVPTEKCHVIKNGVTSFPKRCKYTKGDTIRIIHQNTPWRGLNVLLGAMQYLKDENIELDVYSSTEIYGKDFHEQNKDQYTELYEQAKKLPNVNYIGYRPNDFILQKLSHYHLYVYPSIWEETSCISLLECMAAGLYCVVTNFGALYETGSEFPAYVTYDKNYKKLAEVFAHGIKASVNTLHEPEIQKHLDRQQEFVKEYYNWDKKAMEWNFFLKGITNG